MTRTCEECLKVYDDLYRLTICPHEHFGMATTAVRADGQSKVCTSIEDLNAFMGGEVTDADAGSIVRT